MRRRRENDEHVLPATSLRVLVRTVLQPFGVRL
jgi:hypothetical protein